MPTGADRTRSCLRWSRRTGGVESWGNHFAGGPKGAKPPRSGGESAPGVRRTPIASGDAHRRQGFGGYHEGKPRLLRRGFGANPFCGVASTGVRKANFTGAARPGVWGLNPFRAIDFLMAMARGD
ncbi:hypothetical protein RRG08_014444 [Elysia crispata]|uniref:Uncharacterized protein n=1 Tax=Elysia crispata TaxID=231223 RepID=A0AAE1CIQ5_9GAST|nr:hypothetical protein RRG08_014444 [Elysia crispata]